MSTAPHQIKPLMRQRFWHLLDGIKLVNELEPLVRELGLTLAMGGSVLRTGGSTNDLDLIVFPYCTPPGTTITDWSPLHNLLTSLGWVRLYDKEALQAEWRNRGSNDTKHVEIWKLGMRRIDIIFLQ